MKTHTKMLLVQYVLLTSILTCTTYTCTICTINGIHVHVDITCECTYPHRNDACMLLTSCSHILAWYTCTCRYYMYMYILTQK